MSPDPVTVLLVDDHALVREGVRAILERDGRIAVVAEAATGEEALRHAAEHAPDVALVDLRLRGLDGVATTRLLLARSPRTRVVVLSSHSDDASVLAAVRAGALSYLLKEVGRTELADAVHRAARGEAVLHPRVAALLMRQVRAEADAGRSAAELSPRELEVLRLIADGRSNAQIAAALVLSEKTVKNHVSNVLAKLQISDRTQAAVYAWRSGLMPGG